MGLLVELPCCARQGVSTEEDGFPVLPPCHAVAAGTQGPLNLQARWNVDKFQKPIYYPVHAYSEDL